MSAVWDTPPKPVMPTPASITTQILHRTSHHVSPQSTRKPGAHLTCRRSPCPPTLPTTAVLSPRDWTQRPNVPPSRSRDNRLLLRTRPLESDSACGNSDSDTSNSQPAVDELSLSAKLALTDAGDDLVLFSYFVAFAVDRWGARGTPHQVTSLLHAPRRGGRLIETRRTAAPSTLRRHGQQYAQAGHHY